MGLAFLAATFAFALGSTPIGTQKPEATSLAGKPLYAIDLPNRAKLEADLAQAEKDLAASPNDAEAIIWAGRRLAYLWRYQDSIAMFSKGITLHPDNPKLYRHRGHRYITTRQFDRAIADFDKAVALIKGQAGRDRTRWRARIRWASRAARCTSTSGITSALAHYLKGDYEKSLDA